MGNTPEMMSHTSLDPDLPAVCVDRRPLALGLRHGFAAAEWTIYDIDARAAARQHKSVITTAGDHDISCRSQNENIPCGLCELYKTQSRGVVSCVSDLYPTATARDNWICA